MAFISQTTNLVAELIWPTLCIGCDAPGSLLCDECRLALPWIEQRCACPVCGAPHGFLTCTACDGVSSLRSLVAALSFEGVPARMVRAFKDFHDVRLAPFMAAALAWALEEASAWLAADGQPRWSAAATDLLCFVPATEETVARRGYDHMALVAPHLARELGLVTADILARRSARDQRGLSRDERDANLKGTVCVLEEVTGLNILLIDDVATTGASLRATSEALYERGAASVTGAVFARVW